METVRIPEPFSEYYETPAGDTLNGDATRGKGRVSLAVWALHAGRAPGDGWDGRGLQGEDPLWPRLRKAAGHQAHTPPPGGRQDLRRDVHRRGQADRPAGPPQDRPGHRLRRGRRPVLHRPRV